MLYYTRIAYGETLWVFSKNDFEKGKLNFVEREITMKLRQLKFVAGAVLLALTLSGCYVAPGPGACYWVPGHYGPYGGWHPGHCA